MSNAAELAQSALTAKAALNAFSGDFQTAKYNHDLYKEGLCKITPELAQAVIDLSARVEELKQTLHNTKEVYIGMEGVIPETAPEAYLLQTLSLMYEEAVGEHAPNEELEKGWQPIETAPKDGTDIETDGGLVFWSQNPVCMLGPRCGSYPPGWATSGGSGTDYNLPIRNITKWRLPVAEKMGER